MKVALCVKQVPDTDDIKWTENNTMQREGVESILNPYDVYAAELALKLKRLYNAEITVFTMGPLQAEKVLRYTISLGADNGVLICDKYFAGSDTYATGKTISQAIKNELPDFDIILCGQFAIDGDTAQTGPCIASFLNLPQVTFTKDITEIKERFVTLKRELDDGTEEVKVQTPLLACILKADFEPSKPLIDGVIKGQDAQIKTLTFEDLDLSLDEVGIKGSPTYVSKAFRPESKNALKNFINIDEAYSKICEVLNG